MEVFKIYIFNHNNLLELQNHSNPILKSAAFNTLPLVSPAVIQKAYMNQLLATNPDYIQNLQKSLEVLNNMNGYSLDINNFNQININTDSPNNKSLEIEKSKVEDIESKINQTENITINIEKDNKIKEENTNGKTNIAINNITINLESSKPKKEIVYGPTLDGLPLPEIIVSNSEDLDNNTISDIDSFSNDSHNKINKRINFNLIDPEQDFNNIEKKLKTSTKNLIEDKLRKKEEGPSRQSLKEQLLKSRVKKVKPIEIPKETLKNLVKIAKKVPKNQKELFKIKLKYEILQNVKKF